MVKVSSSSTVLCVYWPGWRQDGQLCCSLQLLLPISYCDFSHRQINIPRSYMYQHFHPYHVLEHLRHAETWWCKYRKAVNIYMHLLILEEYFTPKTVRWTHSPPDIKFGISNIVFPCSFSQEPWVHPGIITEGLHPQAKKWCFSSFFPCKMLPPVFFWNRACTQTHWSCCTL